MVSRRVRRPSHPGWVTVLLLVSWCAFLLTACGGASYSEAAHAPGEPRVSSRTQAPMAPEAASAPDYAMADVQLASRSKAAAAEAPAPAPPPEPPPATGHTAQVSEPSGGAKDRPALADTAEPESGKPEPAVASDAVPIKQVLIYTAQVRMAVFEVDAALAEVEALARSLGGFLARRTDNEITIRVPAAQFDDALEGITSKGDVLTRNVQVEDVTEEYLDVMLRLKNARQVRERIAQLLAKAENVEESLEVERELNRLSAKIERLEGRLKYLRNRARYSTITVTFQPERVDEVPNAAFQLPFPWLRELGLGRLMNLR